MPVRDKKVLLVAKALSHSRLYTAVILLIQYLNPSQAPRYIGRELGPGKPLRRLYELQDRVVPVVDPTRLGLRLRLCWDCSEADYFTVYQLYSDGDFVIDVGYSAVEHHCSCSKCDYYSYFIRTPIPVDNFASGRIERVFDARREGDAYVDEDVVSPLEKQRYTASLIAAASCIASPRQCIGWRNLVQKCWPVALAMRFELIYSKSNRWGRIAKIRSKTILGLLKKGDYASILGFYPSGMISGRLLLIRLRISTDPLKVAAYISPSAMTPGLYCNERGACFMFAKAREGDAERLLSKLSDKGMVRSYEIHVIKGSRHTTLAWEMYDPHKGRWCRARSPQQAKACHERGIVLWSKAGIIMFVKEALQTRDRGAWEQYMDSVEFLDSHY